MSHDEILAGPAMDAAVKDDDRGWRTRSENPPLGEIFRSIRVPVTGGGWRKMAAFVGPGYLVAVGYMDPGNWATSLAGGSKFGYTLLVIALISNIMAIILQSLCARLGIASGRDLAQACRDAFPRPVASTTPPFHPAGREQRPAGVWPRTWTAASPATRSPSIGAARIPRRGCSRPSSA